MKLFNYEVKEPKFKYDDIVWVYFNPQGLVDKSAKPIFQCTIEDLQMKASSEYGKQTTVEYTYTLAFMDTFDEASYKKECDIFATEKEAHEYSILKLKEYAESLKVKSDNYQEIMKKLES